MERACRACQGYVLRQTDWLHDPSWQRQGVDHHSGQIGQACERQFAKVGPIAAAVKWRVEVCAEVPDQDETVTGQARPWRMPRPHRITRQKRLDSSTGQPGNRRFPGNQCMAELDQPPHSRTPESRIVSCLWGV